MVSPPQVSFHGLAVGCYAVNSDLSLGVTRTLTMLDVIIFFK